MTYIPLEENNDMELTLESQEISTKQQSGGMLGPSICSGLFDPPPATKYNFLSLGAGVQSSTLALMAAHGEIGPMPDAAIFADTQAEPESVYHWLDWLEKQLPYPVYRVTKGNLADGAVELKQHQTKPIQYAKWYIPAFTDSPNGGNGILGRKCTQEYKIEPLRKKQKELAGITHGQKNVTVTTWIGISWDEAQRMKASRDAWCQMRWPLIELRMKRHHCLEWMKDHGYPEPPRSACTFCPFHSDTEWRKVKQEPEEFAKVVEFEKKMQSVAKLDGLLRYTPYLHPSLKPIDQVDFRSDEECGQGLLWNTIQNECSGMCGV